MSEAELKLVVTTVDEATKKLAAIQSDLFGMGKEIDALNKKSQALAGGGLKGIRDALASNNSHIQAAKQGMKELGIGVVAVGAALVKTTMDTYAHNQAIGDLAAVWNTSAEEASKMVEVADDVRISQEQMSTAMKFAMKNGIEPSIAGLKEAAAKYQSFTDTQERAAWASKTFGKAWTEVARLLEMSPDQIDASVAAAERFGLVVGGKDVQAAKDLHDNLDNLSDAWTGMKRIIGNGIIPITIKVTNELTKQVDLSFRMEAAQKGLNEAYHRGQITLKKKWVLDNEMRWSDENIYAVEKKLLELQEARNRQMLEAHGTIPVVIRDLQDFSTAEDEAAKAAEALAQAQGELNAQMDLLSLAVSGPIQGEIDSYQSKLDDLNGKYAETVAKIDELKAKRWPTKADKEDIAGLEGDLITIADDIKKTGDAHDEATKRILYNILLQRAAIDGFSEEEYKVLNKVALDWGLVDTATYNFATRAGELLDGLTKNNIEPTTLAIENMGMVSSGIAGTYEIKFVISTSGSMPVAPSSAQISSGNQWGPAASTPAASSNAGYDWRDSAGIPHARGADYIVPSGFGGERWNIGTASSGEHVSITPKGGQSNADVVAAIAGLQAALPRAMRDALIKAQAVA